MVHSQELENCLLTSKRSVRISGCPVKKNLTFYTLPLLYKVHVMLKWTMMMLHCSVHTQFQWYTTCFLLMISLKFQWSTSVFSPSSPWSNEDENFVAKRHHLNYVRIITTYFLFLFFLKLILLTNKILQCCYSFLLLLA